MRRSNAGMWSWAAVLLLLVGPLLAACGTVAPPPPEATSGKSLIEAVEAYMVDLPGASPKLFLTTQIFDRNGVLLAEFWDEGKRYWVQLDQISPVLRQATIAAEDKTFYDNPGVDWTAVVRAAMDNMEADRIVSGASTITQQLARNIAFPYEKRVEQSLDRKLEETVLAQDLLARFTKDQVLEMYLNVVYYGHMAYGVEAAARIYFGKNAADINLAEAALLAALPQAPAYLDPLSSGNLEEVKARQGLVLALMVRNGNITLEEARAAYNEPLQFRSMETPQLAPHFLQYLRERLKSQYGTQIIGRLGLTITTSLDMRIQAIAEGIVRQHVATLRPRHDLTNAALVALKPHTGEILAMVGSADFNDESIDGQVNVTVHPRQPGSAIKPVLYSLAFTEGYTPADLIWDIPADFPLSNGQVYRPRNYDNRFHGPLRLRDALANSYNVPAVKLLDRLGVPAMVNMAHAMGVQGLNRPTEQYGLSLTLGGGEVTLLGLTNAYNTLASGGSYLAPAPVLTMKNGAGQTVWNLQPTPKRVLDPRVAYMVTSVLSDNEARKPAFGANNVLQLSRPAAAKTGTTTDFKDNWTVGYTPYVTVGVWAGNSDGRPMRNSTGLTGAAPIWHDFLEALFARPELDAALRSAGEAVEFQRPDGLVDVPICDLRSLRGGSCAQSGTELAIDPHYPITIGRPSPVPLAPSPASFGTQAAQWVPVSSEIRMPSDPAVSLRYLATSGSRTICVEEGKGWAATLLRVPADAREGAAVRRWAASAGYPVEPSSCTGTGDDAQVTAPGRPPESPATEPAPEPVQEAAASAPEPVQEAAAPSPELVQEVAAPAPAPAPLAGAQASITWPPPGGVLRGPVQVTGNAVFSPEDVEFYKVEFGYGSNPQEWITMGSGHGSTVANGLLETWHAESLPPGSYALRLVLVKRDGNFIATAPVPVEVQN